MEVASLSEIGQELWQLRRKRGLSLTALAQAVGVNKSTLSRWEAGKTAPRSHELATTLEVLRVAPEVAHRFFDVLDRPMAFGADGTRPPVSGDLLRVLRLRRGWTQVQTARATGIPQATLARWEHSETWPTADRLHTLCFALGATAEETATLTQGRFLPSRLPQTRTDDDAMALLEARKAALDEHIVRGHFDYAEFNLLQLEADAWRLARRSDRAIRLLLDVMLQQAMFALQRPTDEQPITQIFNRSEGYVRALGIEHHAISLTQRIVTLQMRRNLPRNRGDDKMHLSLIKRYKALLPQAATASNAPEYRSWIYMDMARNLAGVKNPDRLVVERLMAASYAEPRDTGEPRAEEPATVRYAALTYAHLGDFGRAMEMVNGSMIGLRDCFSGNTTLARIAWASGDRDAATRYLDNAGVAASRMPEHQNLPIVVSDTRDEFLTECNENPRFALR